MKINHRKHAAYIVTLGALLLSAGCAGVGGSSEADGPSVCVERFCLNDPIYIHESHVNDPRVSKLGYPICTKLGTFSFQKQALSNGKTIRVFYASVPGAKKGEHLRISGLEQALDYEPSPKQQLALIEKLNQEYGLPPQSARRGAAGQYFSEGLAKNGRRIRLVVTNHIFLADSENFDQGFSQEQHAAQWGCTTQ